MEYRVVIASGLLVVFTACAAGAGENEQPRREIYSGVSASGGAVFGYLTGVAAIGGGLYSPGWRMRAMAGHGRYSYFSAATRIRGKVSAVEVMPGFQLVRGRFILKLYGGAHFERHDLNRSDPGNAKKGNRLGLKGVGELWVDIGKKAFASLDVSYSSVYSARAAKARLGWRVLRSISLGPELGAFGTRGYKERRAGSFMRAEFGRFAGNLSGGFVRKRGGKRAGYGEFSLEVKF